MLFHVNKLLPCVNFAFQKNMSTGKGPLKAAGLINFYQQLEETRTPEDRVTVRRPYLSKPFAACNSRNIRVNIQNNCMDQQCWWNDQALGLTTILSTQYSPWNPFYIPYRLQSWYELFPADNKEWICDIAFIQSRAESHLVFNILCIDETNFFLHGDVSPRHFWNRRLGKTKSLASGSGSHDLLGFQIWLRQTSGYLVV